MFRGLGDGAKAVEARSKPWRSHGDGYYRHRLWRGWFGFINQWIVRVLYFGQGSEFYTQNPMFWVKIGTFVVVGLLSLYPTITYVLWMIPLRKGELPQVSQALVSRLGWMINIELVGFASIPLLATLMARGVGLASA